MECKGEPACEPGIDTMTKSKSNEFDMIGDDDLLVFQVCDEVLETATGKYRAVPEFTVASCTALTNCPGP
jgi:hypothetical protein